MENERDTVSDIESEYDQCHSKEFRFCEEHGICDRCAMSRDEQEAGAKVEDF